MDDRLEPEMLVQPGGGMRAVFTATLKPVGRVDRFQPAGFPEIGHVIYDAPRGDNGAESVGIVDSAASMANHLESVCIRSPFDPSPVDELSQLPYLRCVTDPDSSGDPPTPYELVLTSLTEGHRIASTYFLDGRRITDGAFDDQTFGMRLRQECGIQDLGRATHPHPDAWWATFRALFRYDPNALVHGVLFPQWQIKVPRVLSAHHEAIGARRVDRSGVKFDRLGKTSSGQPIFAVDDVTATELRATFILDLALLRSFGRDDLGVGPTEKQALAALALWKIGRLLANAFRYRSGCDLECVGLVGRVDGQEVDVSASDLASIDVDRHLGAAMDAVAARDGSEPGVVDLHWARGDLYREAKAAKKAPEEVGEESIGEE